MKKRFLVAAASMAFAAAITACGASSGATANTSAPSATEAETAASEAATAEETSAETAADETNAANEKIIISDAYGEVEVPVNPAVVISLDNRTFKTLSDWGIKLTAVPKAVMSKDSSYVKDSSVQDIGNHREPNLEIIAAANPELVIVGQRFASYYEDIKALVPDAAVISLDIDVSEKAENAGENLVNGLKGNTETLGRIFSKEADAEALIAELDAAIEDAKNAYNPEQTVMSVNVNGGEIGYLAPGFGRVYGPWYEIMGWTPALKVDNATSNHKGDEVSVEAIAQSNPDIIMVLDRDAAVSEGSTPAMEVIEKSEAMKNVNAVKNGKVVYAPADTYVNESIQTYIELMHSVAETLSK